MTFRLDNQTLLYIVIALFVVQFFVMRYYVQSTIGEDLDKNNKKMVKKFSNQINRTFDQYMGPRVDSDHRMMQEVADEANKYYDGYMDSRTRGKNPRVRESGNRNARNMEGLERHVKSKNRRSGKSRRHLAEDHRTNKRQYKDEIHEEHDIQEDSLDDPAEDCGDDEGTVEE